MPVVDIEVDSIQKQMIIDLFNEGKSITKIKKEVFEYSYQGFLSKMPEDIKYYNHSLNLKILEILNIDNWNDYQREYQKRRYMRRKDIPAKIRNQVLERDNHQCCVTKKTDDICIHHIDHDPNNNDPLNLITLNRKVHKAIHTLIIKNYSKYKLKNYEVILQYRREYIEYIKENGYPNADIIIDKNYIHITTDNTINHK